jgi:hypothetical protein
MESKQKECTDKGNFKKIAIKKKNSNKSKKSKG